MNAVSLFSGIGGIDLALEQAGIRVVAAVEIDKDCRDRLATHFPDVTLFDDVTKVTGDQLLAAGFVPGTGLLAAGWPCQGNSVAGRRGGMGDPRSGLWRHVVRLLAETRPAWFLGENVPGLLSVNDGRDIAVVRGDLAQLGYWWAERILDAQYFGVPQRRQRVFFVGRLGDDRAAPVQVLLEPESSDGHPASCGAARPGTAAASDGGTVGSLMAGSDGRGWRIGADEAAAGQLVTETLRSHPRPGSNSNGQLVTLPLTGGGFAGQNGVGVGSEGDPSLTLDTTGNQGVALIPFDGAQITHPENRVNPQPGDPMVPLTATGQPSVAYALSTSANRNDREQTWVVPTLTAAMGSNAGAPGDSGKDGMVLAVAHALTSAGADASEDGTGRGTPLVVTEAREQFCPSCGCLIDFHDADGFCAGVCGGNCVDPQWGRPGGDWNSFEDDADPAEVRAYALSMHSGIAAPLTSGSHGNGVSAPGRRQEDDVNLIPIDLRNAARETAAGDTAGTGIGNAGDPSFTLSATARALPGLATGAAVRRLTPLECERLQGFPDNWTAGQSDSARYRQLGNAVAVPCVAWIARRISALETAA